MITNKNYEAYFIDFIEDRLSRTQLTELKQFLNLNPHLKEELEGYRPQTVLPNDETFPDKKYLKKYQFETSEIGEHNFTDFCIAWHEQLLSEEKSHELSQFIKNHTEKLKEFNFFEKVYLKPGNEIFKYKESIYKKSPEKKIGITAIIKYSTVAACITLFVGISLYKYQKANENKRATPLVYNFRNQLTKKSSIPTKKKAIASFALPQNKTVASQIDKIITKRNIFGSKESFTRDSLQTLALIKPKPYLPSNDETEKILNASFHTVINNKPHQTSNDSLFYGILAKNKDNSDIANNDDNDFSLFQLAKKGIKAINKFSNANLKLDRRVDESGNITTTTFESKVFKYYQSKKDN